ncbi:hypothetical protein SAMN05660862_3588 [Sphingobacterium psychroaquaticum]|uniref:Uncharacterized protein n=1 Tax=Sphingobacterium psychroaquaticum TaxID=561061 RepID=A0A1X7L4T3_9SPHI|nr:hypothetical protein SAMN05660862_3588 [Sphingobacterium psychroaquaticum]
MKSKDINIFKKRRIQFWENNGALYSVFFTLSIVGYCKKVVSLVRIIIKSTIS